MKKTTILIVACCTILFANAQYQSIFGQNSTSWAYWSDAPSRNPAFIYTLFSDNSDTLINNHLYKKIKYQERFNSQIFISHFLREDTITGRVFSLHLGLNEVEIMNMNLTVGDSFCLAPLFMTNCVKRMVDSVYTDSLGRKVIRFDAYIHYHSTWKFIEGIGRNAQYRLKDGMAEPVEDLVCSHKDNIRVFINDYGETCPAFNVQINESSIQPIKIYPNPNQGFVTLDIGNLKDVSIKILGLNGQLLYKADNINNPLQQVELKGPPGIYILELSSNGKTKHYKLLKN